MCEEIINLATTIVHMQKNAMCLTESPPKRPLFCIDMGIVAPLYSIVHRCLDPILRRKAIALLHSAPRQEGLWHSSVTARVCEKIVFL